MKKFFMKSVIEANYRSSFHFAAVIILSIAFVSNSTAQEVFVQTGFEEFTVGKPPQGWETLRGQFEVTGDTVKTDKKSLAILGGADGDGLGVPIETKNPVVSVEF